MTVHAKSVLVTGVAGFIGRHVAREFAHSGWRVFGTDRFTPGASFLAEWHVAAFEVLDLTHGPPVALVRRWQPDVLVHAAGSASVPVSLEDPLGDFSSSAVVLFNVLEAVRRYAPACRLVFLSSAAVYGNPHHLPIAENHPLTPISPYGFHKVLCETITQEFNAIYGVKTCSVRIFSAYGNGLRRQVLWDICRKALSGSMVELFGTGHETRDFIHVTDVARAIGAIAEAARFEGELYNVACGREVAIRDLAQRLIKALSRDCKLRFSGMIREGDPQRWCADVTQLSLLGFRPSIAIEQGVASYARWLMAESESGAS
jgi:UDP-glucose 4-epimerase